MTSPLFFSKPRQLWSVKAADNNIPLEAEVLFQQVGGRPLHSFNHQVTNVGTKRGAAGATQQRDRVQNIQLIRLFAPVCLVEWEYWHGPPGLGCQRVKVLGQCKRLLHSRLHSTYKLFIAPYHFNKTEDLASTTLQREARLCRTVHTIKHFKPSTSAMQQIGLSMLS